MASRGCASLHCRLHIGLRNTGWHLLQTQKAAWAEWMQAYLAPSILMAVQQVPVSAEGRALTGGDAKSTVGARTCQCPGCGTAGCHQRRPRR